MQVWHSGPERSDASSLARAQSYFAMWFLMGDAAPPRGIANALAIAFMALSFGSGVLAAVSLLVLVFPLSRRSKEGMAAQPLHRK